jgi:hypothetical protein
MCASHRTNRLKVIGNPSVEKLQNDRFRLTFNMTPLNARNDWFNDNKDRIFADFGTLSSAEMSVDGIDPRHKSSYPDMRLVAAESGNRSRVEGGEYIVQFVYETLGSTFVQVKDDTVDYELNGLRRVTRQSIAKEGTDFQKTVGTTFIDHQIDTETAVRCFLSSYEIDDTDSFRRVEEVYIQAGTLSVNTRHVSEGIQQETKVFLVTEGTTTGPIINRSTDNFLGLKRISVTTMQDKDGNSIVGTNPNLVHSYERLVDFRFPGVVGITTQTDAAAGLTIEHKYFDLQPPVTSKVESQINVFFQTESNILADDFTFDSSQGLWNPTSWAEGKIKGLSTNFSLTTARPLSQTKGFVGYTQATGGTTEETVNGGTGANAKAIEGNLIAPTSVGRISVSGGPGTPSGKYVLDVDVRPAFEDIDGNIYFKKTIVTATV